MRVPDIRDWSPRQKQWAIVAAVTAVGGGVGTMLYLDRDIIGAKIEATRDFARHVAEIEPRMTAGFPDWNMRYYMRNCGYEKDSKPHAYELTAPYSRIPLDAREDAVMETGAAETRADARRAARNATDRDYDVDSFSVGDVSHFKRGAVCHGRTLGCKDAYDRGIKITIGYTYEEEYKVCVEKDKDDNCTKRETRYRDETDSVTNTYVFQSVAGIDAIRQDPMASRLRDATLESALYGLKKSESRIVCPPVTGYTGGGGAHGHW